MELCLSSAFEQDYSRFEIIFAVESPDDPAIRVAQRIMDRYPSVNAKLLIGSDHYGPNPKVNNLSKAYFQAQYDIIWVLDSNVWVSSGTLARSVDVFFRDPKIKLVHHLPNCVALSSSYWGALLDEMFLMTSHSKFYMAINTVAISACVTGKSNLYRRSDLDVAAAAFTTGSSSSSTLSPRHIEPNTGIREFAKYIAEDNMIAEALWALGGRTALTCDTAVQPIGYVPFEGYWSRRVRWLRVRRYMVFVATLLEPLTESIVCGVYGTFAVSVLFLHRYFSCRWFMGHMLLWCMVDYFHFHNQLEFKNMEQPVPYFVSKFFNPDNYHHNYTSDLNLYETNSSSQGETLESSHPAVYNSSITETNSSVSSSSLQHNSKRSLKTWLPVWILRETLALPIWISAMCGSRIFWRNRPFKINSDLSAEEIR
ncbi:hypothetical protein NADFUDRAFT_84313 [Nadsonia fulvescens var. elongata DSM 6958]|uniref:Ceramide glucosyltransferase n=1 Tax=Nadsonia fulvescens var. elongata DSM 6958 TaxID=857566 RepID=A0A1E3PEF9_9ASCO|nr:hypothetical protein NADFUDRAFT_84313 [Nadsonia fulvescens var. elongata DSM 6958]